MRLPARSLFAAAAMALAVSACTSSDGGPGRVAATVDGVEIASSVVQASVDAQEALLADVPEDDREDARREAERNALTSEIQLVAVEAAAAERWGIEIADEDIDAALEGDIEAQGGDEAFAELAEEQGVELEQAREFARESSYVRLLIDEIRGKLAEEEGIDEAALQAAYDENITSFQSSDVRHILVQTEEEAQDVLARLAEGEDFGAIAGEVSLDPGSGANGGSLGPAPRGTYVEPFSDAVYSEDTELGEVVGPIETQFGFHVLIVDDRTTLSFEEARPQLEAQLSNTAFTAFLDEVFTSIEVTVDPYYGTWSSERKAVVAPEEPEVEGEVGEDADENGEEAPADDADAGDETGADADPEAES